MNAKVLVSSIVIVLLFTIGVNAHVWQDQDFKVMFYKYSSEELKNTDNLYVFQNNFFEKFTLFNKLILFIEKIIDSKITPDKKDNLDEVYDGYTLFAPMWDTKTYLIDNNGKVLNTWSSLYTDSQAVYLL